MTFSNKFILFVFLNVAIVHSIHYLNHDGSPGQAQSYGMLEINVNRQKKQLHVVSRPGLNNNLKPNGNSIRLSGNSGFYLATSAPNKVYNPNAFYRLSLLGKTISYTLQTSNVNCNCNAAVYLVDAPAYNRNNQQQPGQDGSYYCDGNNVNGQWCPEMDLSESNKYAFQTAPHKCTGKQGKFWSSCDRDGCSGNAIKKNKNSFGPEQKFIINTKKPFNVKIKFQTQGNTLTGINTKITQNNKKFQYGACGDKNYLNQFGKQLANGLAFRVTLWGSNDMNWLNGPSGCKGGCNVPAQSYTLSNVRVY